ncbi:MAG TPA: hypothetical protein VK747_04190 [Blastocatellia bacterium]|nr:hypothetical protein [Blastocatellia bacterium]
MVLRSIAILSLWLSSFSAFGSVVVQEKSGNVVVREPNVNRCQAGSHQVAFLMPDGWTSDNDALKKFGGCAVLVPVGTTLQTTKKAILIVFKQRDPRNPDFSNLKAYANANLKAMKARFRDVKIDERQIPGRDTKSTAYVAYEVYGKVGPSPSLYMFVNASDGFYTVSVTALTQDELKSPETNKFFSTLAIL